MSLQNILNQQAINMLQNTKKLLDSVKHPLYSNLYAVCMRMINNSSICLDSMTKEQLSDFDNEVFDCLRYKLSEYESI